MATPYVQLQEHIISWLWKVQEQKDGNMFLRGLVAVCRQPYFRLERGWLGRLENIGLTLPQQESGWDVYTEAVKIIIEQVDDTGPEIIIRNVLGSPLYHHSPYGINEWPDHRGSGQNRIRETYYAQSGALRPGDRLVTGETILSEPREGGNGSVLIHLSGGKHGTWIGVPSRLALALSVQTDSFSNMKLLG